MAEREGFEPSIRFWRILTFQASAFDHSATAPHAWNLRRLDGAAGMRKVAAMTRRFDTAPTIAEFEVLARAALARIPPPFADSMDEIVLLVEDLADDETLDAMGIEDPFDLTGLYQGRPLTSRGIEDSGVLPDRIRLFRRAILDEWAERGDETLEHLVAHVVIHEVGHHFGLSDADMHALEGE